MSVAKDKNGKWFCRVSHPIGNKKYKTVSRYGFSTKQEALLKEAQIKENLIHGRPIEFEGDSISFYDYFVEWINANKIGVGLSRSTESKYEYCAKMIKEHFGDTQLNHITRTDYQKFINWRGKNKGKDIISKNHSYIKQSVSDALYDGLIEKDFTYKIKIRYDKEENKRIKYWNKEEYSKLVTHFKSDVNLKNAMLLIQSLTGLRIGEVFGLSWSDINFDEKTLSVNRGYDHHTNSFTRGKNSASIRTIKVTDELLRYLKRYRLKSGLKSFLFLDDKERPLISYNGIRKYLTKTCASLGVQNLPTHSLRHTHCSVLIFEGVSIYYISKRLGHSGVTETLKTYSHVIDEQKQKDDTKTLDVLDRLTAE